VTAASAAWTSAASVRLPYCRYQLVVAVVVPRPVLSATLCASW
jgi:hypothetical protein